MSDTLERDADSAMVFWKSCIAKLNDNSIFSLQVEKGI